MAAVLSLSPTTAAETLAEIESCQARLGLLGAIRDLAAPTLDWQTLDTQ